MKKLAVTVFFAMLFFSGLIERGFSQAPFYEGKTITVVLGTAAGALGDLRTKALVAVLRKHIPGNPTIVIEYMPGGGGRKAANHMYKSARPDGLTIGAMLAAFVPTAFLDVGVLYDLDKLIYLGAIQSGVSHVFHTRKGAGLDTLAKLRTASGVRIPAPSVGHITYSGGRTFAKKTHSSTACSTARPGELCYLGPGAETYRAVPSLPDGRAAPHPSSGDTQTADAVSASSRAKDFRRPGVF
jgi:tripartite-type tricarboxylate transporter receptor subunit TctC